MGYYDDAYADTGGYSDQQGPTTGVLTPDQLGPDARKSYDAGIAAGQDMSWMLQSGAVTSNYLASGANASDPSLNPLTGKPFTGLTNGIPGDPNFGKPYTPGPPPGPPPPTTGSGGGAAPPPVMGGQTGLLAPFTGQFTPPPVPFPGATGNGVPTTPTFTPPAYTPPPAFSYADFTAPSATDVLNDPGYQFSANEGERALQQSKAAGGTLNTGGTLKDILAWGSNYANTRYGDVLNRDLTIYGNNRANALSNYNTNYQTQYTDPYSYAYKGALDAFAPQMTAFTTNAASNQRANELSYNNAYDLFNFDYRKFQDQRDSTFNKIYQTAIA